MMTIATQENGAIDKEVKMGFGVLLLGKSGAGKSRSIKTFEGNVGVIKVIEKALPFKSNQKTITCSDYASIKDILLKCEAKSIIIDDAGYLLTTEFMRNAATKGFDKFTDMANNFYDLIQFITLRLPADKIVYLVMHEETTDTGQIKPKTLGKLLDDKICVEGMFTIVLRCVEHRFFVNNSGCAKTPEDMFDRDEIDNDLKLVDTTIREYYNL